MAKNTDRGLVATIYNNHVAGCGKPPALDSRNFDFFAVFENKHGEQMVLVREKHAHGLGSFRVYCGDAGWDKPRRVNEGGMFEPDLVLSPGERAVLAALHEVATAYDKFRHEDVERKDGEQAGPAKGDESDGRRTEG